MILQGCGRELHSLDLREYTSVAMAQDALGLLDYLGWERAHILGASLGAQAASKLAAMAPHRSALQLPFNCLVLLPVCCSASSCYAVAHLN